MTDPWDVLELKIEMDATFNWSVGSRMERFIRELGNRKIVGIKCPDCDRVFVPPRMICEKCFAETDGWVELGTEGTVEGYTVGHVKVDGKAGGLIDLAEPEIVALIRPDGANSCLIHRIGETGPDKVRTSMRVQAVWAEDTRGDLADLLYFRPVG